MKTRYEMSGIECKSGWKGLYEPLIDLCNLRGVPILQIKEKFGGLRFYIGAVEEDDKDIQLLIDAAEQYSYKVCEECGVSGYAWDGGASKLRVSTGPSETSGWIRSLCEECRRRWDEGRRGCTIGMRIPC